MQIESTKDFKRSREKVLSKFRDPERIEAVLQGMNATAVRVSDFPQAAWDCSINWRDEPRKFTARLVETAQNETMVLTITSDLADATIKMDFYDLPDKGCRVMSVAQIKAHSMMVKLALQSLRLVRGKAEERLTRVVNSIGRP